MKIRELLCFFFVFTLGVAYIGLVDVRHFNEVQLGCLLIDFHGVWGVL